MWQGHRGCLGGVLRRPHHLLLIEDDDGDAAVIRRWVEALGDWRVTRVGSLEQAEAQIARVGRDGFDVVAVDLSLPDAVDLEAVHFARAMLPDTVCVALTGGDPTQHAEQVLRAGASDLLVKGQFNARGVQRSVTHALERHAFILRERELERNLRSVLAAWTDALVVVDDDGRVLYRNAAAEALEGLDPDGLRSVRVRPGEIVQTEAARRPLELRSWRMSWGGRPARVVVIRDRGAELALDRAMGRIRDAEVRATVGEDALKGLHDVRNLVSVARGELADLAGEVAPPLQGRVAAIRRVVDHIADVVRSARDGATSIRRRSSLDLGALVRRSCASLQSEIQAVASLRLVLPTGAIVLGDPVGLRRAVENLLGNAIEAMSGHGAGPHELRVSIVADGVEVVLEVEDSGPGFGDAVEHALTARWTTKPTGTGLGLATVWDVVQAHGGRVELGSGALGGRVVVALPAAEAGHEGLRVLLVEDEPSVARAEWRILSPHMTIEVAADGEEALARLKEDRAFDAILCDVDMAGMDGLSLYQALVEADPCLAERFVFCTGGASVEVEAWLANTGRPVLTKPLDPATAIAAIAATAARASAVQDVPEHRDGP